MDLVRLTYTSTAAADFRAEDLTDIVAASQRNNRRDCLTGFLVYAARKFTQSLEGRPEVVRGVFDRIRRDRRHRDVRVIAMRPVDARGFANWEMELVHLDAAELEAVSPILEPRAVPLATADTALEDKLMRLVGSVYRRSRVGDR